MSNENRKKDTHPVPDLTDNYDYLKASSVTDCTGAVPRPPQNSAELDPARVQAMGYGQWRPVAGNDDESERTKNRRVEMTISGKDLENTLSDSITQYYTTTGQERPGHEGEQTAP